MTNINRGRGWSFRTGLLIIILTHVYMLFFDFPSSQAVPHAIINLVASGLLLYAWHTSSK